mmetsp:Transcript_52944/g.92992  ORF Transcript_52944/g.92992 Transcript_52944/m.92992 type:complete len:857 (-) Transcript_52944:169-2739(-)
MPSRALYNLATMAWQHADGVSSLGRLDEAPAADENGLQASQMYNSASLQDCRQRREESEERCLQLQQEHDRLLKRALDVIEPHQALNPVTDKQEPPWATPPRPISRSAPQLSLSAPVTPRTSRKELSTPRKDPSTPRREPTSPRGQAKSLPPAGPGTPLTTTCASQSSIPWVGSPMLKMSKNSRTRSRSLSSEDLELMDQCTFQPNLNRSRRRLLHSEPPTFRPTKSSILRDEAIWKRQDEKRANARAASPVSSSTTLIRPCASELDNSIMSRQTSDDQSTCSLSTALTLNMSLAQQRALEEKLAAEVEEASRALRRKVDTMMSARSAHEARTFTTQLNRIRAADQREQLDSAIEERRQKDTSVLFERQESARQLKDERAKGPPKAVGLVKENRALRGMIGRDERRIREEVVHLEEKALLEERRAHVRKMQELENERARLLQEWRARDIERKRKQLMDLRQTIEEQHQSRKTTEEDEANEKRAERKQERVRKYEDLLGRAKHLEELRELDRALTEQIRNDMDDLQAVRDRKIQEAREQAMLEMEARFMEKRHQMLLEQETTLGKLVHSNSSTPRTSPRSRPESTPRTTPRTTPRMTPRSESSRTRDPGSPRSSVNLSMGGVSVKSNITLASPMSSGDRYRSQKSATTAEELPNKSRIASPSSSSIVQRLLSTRTRTLTTRARQHSSPPNSNKLAEEALQKSGFTSVTGLTSGGSEVSVSHGLAAQAGTWLQTTPQQATPNTSRVDMTANSPALHRAVVPPLYLASPASPTAYKEASSSGVTKFLAGASVTPGASSTTTMVPPSGPNINSACKGLSSSARVSAPSPSCFTSFSPSVLLPVHGGCSPGSHVGATNGKL